MLNRVILIGRLVADPEYRQTQSGVSVCRFRIAVDRPYQKDKERQADFISCTAWRNTAEFVSRYFSKGKMIIVEGSLHNNDYTDNNGVKHHSMDVQSENVGFGESKGQNAGNQQQSPQFGAVPQYGAPQAAPAGEPLNIGDLGGFEEIIGGDGAPF